MDNADINLAVAQLEFPDRQCEIVEVTPEPNPSRWVLVSGVSGHGAQFVHYVNNWETMGPIIAREGINLTFSEAGVTAHANGHTCTADTPTMAAALCYVKTKNINTTQRA